MNDNLTAKHFSRYMIAAIILIALLLVVYIRRSTIHGLYVGTPGSSGAASLEFEQRKVNVTFNNVSDSGPLTIGYSYEVNGSEVTIQFERKSEVCVVDNRNLIINCGPIDVDYLGGVFSKK